MSERCKIIEPVLEIDKILYENVTEYNYKFMEIGDEKILMPIKYLDLADKIENFHVRDTDIFVASHPRTGTTWTTEMVWMICNLDYEKTKTPIEIRFPFIESSTWHDVKYFKELMPGIKESVTYTENLMENPRFIKTHLPWSVLPKDIREGKKHPKIIYVYRNPKDTLVSYYHFTKAKNYRSTFEDFCKLFLNGKLPYGPFWTNVLEYWKRRNDPNILFIRYEDMKKDLKSVIITVADFLNKTLTDEDIEKLLFHLDIKNMKKMNYTFESEKKVKSGEDEENSKLIRKGVVGGYKKEMSEEMIKKFDDWILQNTKETDFVP